MGGGVVWGEGVGAGVWCVRMRWSDPVGMQPRGEGRGMRGRGVGWEVSSLASGLSTAARAAGSGTALRCARHLVVWS